MITIMRKHHKVLMIFITGLVCISFSWYWNKTDFAQMGNGVVGRIYDRNVSQVEFQRNSRLLRLAADLGMRDLTNALTIGAQTENEAYENFSWNLMVLRHEADALGIKPTTAEIADAVKTLPVFQGKDGFDLAKYTDFADHALAPMGFSEAQIEELASDQIAMDRVQKLLGTGVSIAESQMRNDFQQAYSKMEISVVRFHAADFASQVQVSDDDVSQYYEAHKAELKSDEKRQVAFVSFVLSGEEKKLTGKPRIDVLQKLADNADDFTDALQVKGTGFDSVAKKFNLTPTETGEFTEAVPAPQLATVPELAKAAFALSNDAPNSDAIQASDGFYIEHLVKIDPARPLTLEEARPKIVETIKQDRVQTLIASKAAAAVKEIREAIKNGKPVEEGAAKAGVKAESIPAFALLEQPPDATLSAPEPKNEPPDLQTIKKTASEMHPGDVSDLVPEPQGGLLVVLEKREPLDTAKFNAAKPLLERRTLENKTQVVFFEWLRERRREADIRTATKPQTANS